MDTDKKIKAIINCVETGTPYLDYASHTFLHDGPNRALQYTLSVGFTEYGGNLKKVIDLYIAKDGKYANELSPYSAKIGKMPSLANDKRFDELLMKASKEDQLMKDAQDEVYDAVYYNPAMKWAENNGLKSPLARLVVFDSMLQSGKVFDFLRNRFQENIPRNGGDEHRWISEYVRVRHDWLKSNGNESVRNSAYRTRTYKKLIESGNWDLVGDVKVENGCIVKDQ